MEEKLITVLEKVLYLAYPETWETAWLSIPIQFSAKDSPYFLNIICSDLPQVNQTIGNWPPKSNSPKAWIQWEREKNSGFWIRPRQFDPILRDRFILIEFDEIQNNSKKNSITFESLINACFFSTKSCRIVWHNPSKGGASSPDSAHFQSMPLFYDNSTKFTLPCCYFNIANTSLEMGYCLFSRGFSNNNYPILGLVVWGEIKIVAKKVWEIIDLYDNAHSCNLIFQPITEKAQPNSEKIRVFVFPRSRKMPNHLIKNSFLAEDEKILLRNNRNGVLGEWSFAGVEMGLLTQVEWGNLFYRIKSNPLKWGKTFHRLLLKLSLNEESDDWKEFLQITKKCLR